MSIVDDLIENLIERNTIRLNGTLTVALVDGWCVGGELAIVTTCDFRLATSDA